MNKESKSKMKVKEQGVIRLKKREYKDRREDIKIKVKRGYQDEKREDIKMEEERI